MTTNSNHSFAFMNGFLSNQDLSENLETVKSVKVRDIANFRRDSDIKILQP